MMMTTSSSSVEAKLTGAAAFTGLTTGEAISAAFA
jgi:hypothetical protein